jgi:hypothetical protein
MVFKVRMCVARLLTFGVLVFAYTNVRAQTWSEFFQQKKTQKQYLLEQLVALKIYAGYLEKGYEIAGDGLDIVRGFKNGEFSLHEFFFSSLKIISPLVSSNPRMISLITMEQEIFRISRRDYTTGLFGPSEMAYITGVQTDLARSVAADLESLSTILEADKLEMSEEERFERFNLLYEWVCERYQSATGFDASVRILLAQKTKSLEELK